MSGQKEDQEEVAVFKRADFEKFLSNFEITNIESWEDLKDIERDVSAVDEEEESDDDDDAQEDPVNDKMVQAVVQGVLASLSSKAKEIKKEVVVPVAPVVVVKQDAAVVPVVLAQKEVKVAPAPAPVHVQDKKVQDKKTQDKKQQPQKVQRPANPVEYADTVYMVHVYGHPTSEKVKEHLEYYIYAYKGDINVALVGPVEQVFTKDGNITNRFLAVLNPDYAEYLSTAVEDGESDIKRVQQYFFGKYDFASPKEDGRMLFIKVPILIKARFAATSIKAKLAALAKFKGFESLVSKDTQVSIPTNKETDHLERCFVTFGKGMKAEHIAQVRLILDGSAWGEKECLVHCKFGYKKRE